MSWLKGIAVAIIIVSLFISCGCMSGPSPKVSTTPTPAYGTLRVTSSPLGAKVTIDGIDRGYTPLTLVNITAGLHNVTVSLSGYNAESGQVEVKGGQEVTFSRSLGEADPRIEVREVSLSKVGCNWEVNGRIANTGGENARNMKLTLKMTPKDSAFQVAERTIEIGDFASGNERSFFIEVAASCATGYTGELSWEYTDAEGERHSGSRGL